MINITSDDYNTRWVCFKVFAPIHENSLNLPKFFGLDFFLYDTDLARAIMRSWRSDPTTTAYTT